MERERLNRDKRLYKYELDKKYDNKNQEYTYIGLLRKISACVYFD